MLVSNAILALSASSRPTTQSNAGTTVSRQDKVTPAAASLSAAPFLSYTPRYTSSLAVGGDWTPEELPTEQPIRYRAVRLSNARLPARLGDLASTRHLCDPLTSDGSHRPCGLHRAGRTQSSSARSLLQARIEMVRPVWVVAVAHWHPNPARSLGEPADLPAWWGGQKLKELQR